MRLFSRRVIPYRAFLVSAWWNFDIKKKKAFPIEFVQNRTIEITSSLYKQIWLQKKKKRRADCERANGFGDDGHTRNNAMAY